jgi:FkbM family methyltransferase
MNSFLIKTRSLARKLGIISVVKRLLPQRDYEEKFNAALLNAIRTGDVVWDVGANVGFYTRQFAEIVGAKGTVFAFEPSPEAAARVTAIAADLPAVQLIQAALSKEAGKAFFDVSSGGDSVTNHLAEQANGSETGRVEVDVVTGDVFSSENGVPAIIKIDVEGFELEVLQGMEALLSKEGLRGVFCEVHFSVLESRGLANAPIEIERRLKAAGFSVDWIDSSHIAATK